MGGTNSNTVYGDTTGNESSDWLSKILAGMNTGTSSASLAPTATGTTLTGNKMTTGKTYIPFIDENGMVQGTPGQTPYPAETGTAYWNTAAPAMTQTNTPTYSGTTRVGPTLQPYIPGNIPPPTGTAYWNTAAPAMTDAAPSPVAATPPAASTLDPSILALFNGSNNAGMNPQPATKSFSTLPYQVPSDELDAPLMQSIYGPQGTLAQRHPATYGLFGKW